MEVGKHRVKTVRQGGKYRAFLPKGHEREVQNVVRPIGQKDLARRHAVQPRQLLPQPGPLWVGVEPQVRHLPRAQGRQNLRGGGIGGLIGVEFDVLLVPGLLSGGVRLQARVPGVQKSAHGVSSAKAGSNRMSTLRAWPVRPSFLAKLDTDIWAFSRALLV